MKVRGPGAELGQQVFPFVKQLALGFLDLAAEPGARDFGGVEVVASKLGFVGDAGQEGGDGLNRAWAGAEAGELRVFGVAAGAPLQNFLSEQGLTPGGNESFGIKVPWMEGPDSHSEAGGGVSVLPETGHCWSWSIPQAGESRKPGDAGMDL